MLNVLAMLGKLNGDSLVQASEPRTDQASDHVSDPRGYCPDCLPAPECAYCFQEARGAVDEIEGLDIQSVEPLEGVWPTKLRACNIPRQSKQRCNKDEHKTRAAICLQTGSTVCLQPGIISKNPTNCTKQGFDRKKHHFVIKMLCVYIVKEFLNNGTGDHNLPLDKISQTLICKIIALKDF